MKRADTDLSPEIDARIFVVGAPRSGTTLVQSLLAAHGAATSFTESHFFARHYRLLPGSGRAVLISNPAADLRRFLAENEEEPPAAAAEIERETPRARPLLPLRSDATARRFLQMLDQVTLRRGRTVWIEKTPRHLRFLPYLERVAGPDSGVRFVHVIRRGLDVVASLHTASRQWERSYDVDTCVRRWNGDVELSAGRVGGERDHFVVYERLAAEPEATLRSLLAELGLAWEPEILERYAEISDRLITNDEVEWKADLGRGIRRSSTADKALTAEQRDTADRALRHDLYDSLLERAV